ncbi:MAG: DUF6456 domain-containing protein [Sphingomonadales bacterium]
MKKKIPVSSFGFKVLQKLDTSLGGRLFPDGRCQIGSLKIPATLVEDFLQKDLIRISAQKTVLLSEPGRMLLHLQKKIKRPAINILGDPFRAQHSSFQKEQKKVGKKTETIVRNMGNTPLSWLMKRKDKFGKTYINQQHLEAGEKLSEDFEYSGLYPKTTGFYDGVPISGRSKGGWRASNPTERQLAAKGRVSKALDFVGPGLSDVLVRVCCFHEGLEQAERQLAWPPRSGKLVLKIALERLVEHYNPKNNQNG